MQDGAYNDVLLWHYSRLPEIFGAGRGFIVKTEAELDEALAEAKKWEKSFCLLDVQLDPQDRSPALERLAERLALRL
jgi:TPP-dependent 2-oxoacid decarboxylase